MQRLVADRRGAVPLEALLEALRVPLRDRGRVRALLEDRGLTRPGKTGIAADKAAAVEQLLARTYTWLCDACQVAEELPVGDPSLLSVGRDDCAGCQGSDDLRALRAMGDACARAGVRRIVVLGGSPTVRRRLRELDYTGVEVRFVEGDVSRAARRADANKAWADLLIVIASSHLPHKVSLPYTQDLAIRHKLITVPRRGLAALAEAISRHVATREAR